jgi:hypothetical protein
MHGDKAEVKPTAIYIEVDGWFSASRLPYHLAQAGFHVIGLFDTASPASRSAALAERQVGAIPSLASWLDGLVRRHPDALILPADEAALQLLIPLLDETLVSAPLHAALERSLGAASGRVIAASKERTVAFAARLGITVPDQIVADDLAASLVFAGKHSYPVVLKLENSAGGAGVRICRNADEVASGFLELARMDRMHRGLRRFLLPLARRFPSLLHWAAARYGAPRLIVQQFIHGRPAFTTFAAWNGSVLAELVALVEQTLPRSIGLSSVVSFAQNREMSVATTTLTRALHLSGLVGIDFMIEEATGRAYLLEINARSTPTAHLGQRLGADLCMALAAACVGKPNAACATATREETVALFPNEIDRDPDSPWLRADDQDNVFHDVPLDQPELMQAWREKIPPDSAILQRLDADLQGAVLGIGKNTT